MGLFLSACGGGSSSGGAPVSVTAPPTVTPPTRLSLSEVTIKHHLKSLRSKLGARNRTHAVCRAVELGIAEDDYAMA